MSRLNQGTGALAGEPDSPASALQGFPPWLDDQTRVLILGSFPSVASLAAGQYYAHPRNQFWPLMGELLGFDARTLSYPARMRHLRAAGVGLWDVFATCVRPGSLDSSIRQGLPNDLSQLRALAPRLQRICFNGTTAARHRHPLSAMGYELRILPSTSPAHATKCLTEKLAEWRCALDLTQSGPL